MAVTKAEVLAKANELQLTLTDEQVEQLIRENKLPDEAFKKALEADSKLKTEVGEIAYGIIQALRKENAERRLKVKELEEKVTKTEQQKLEAEEAEKVKNNEFKTLYETQKKTLEELKAKADAFTNYQNTKREEIKVKLGDKYKSAFDKLELNELEEVAGLLIDSKIPVSGDKARGGSGGSGGAGGTDEPDPADKLQTLYKSNT